MRSLVALALGMSIAACGGDDPSAPDPLPVRDDTSYTKTPTATPSASASADPPTAPPSGTRRWKGSLAKTAPVTFGASSCSYRITLQDLQVDILEVDADVVTATVTLTSVEETLPPCSAPPIPPNAHTYVLGSSSTLPNGTHHLELSPMAANRPAAALVLEGAMSTPKSTVDLAFHRIDNGAPFDWRVSAEVVVSALSRP